MAERPTPTAKRVASLVITGIRECLTLAGGECGPRAGLEQEDLGIVRDAAVAAGGKELLYVGEASGLPAVVKVAPDTVKIDAAGGVVLPGFVDPHTHLLFGGWRAGEFTRRLAGDSYRDVLKAGGGILSTVEATRAMSEEQLVEIGALRLERMLEGGTTTVEAKSGYGLSLADEAKLLRAVNRLNATEPVDLVPTLLAAHAFPREYRQDRTAYVDLATRIVETLADRAEFVDAFCEEGAFSVDECQRVLSAGQRAGLGVKVHVDQLSDGGGAAMAAELGAVSADHLDHVSTGGIAALAGAGVIAVLLPSVPLYLGSRRQAPAATLQAAGVPLALATDFNPGTSPMQAMGTVVSLACMLLRISPAAALMAATRNAAWAIGRGERVGTLAVGMQADLQIYSIPDHRMLPYRFGELRPQQVIKCGRVVVGPHYPRLATENC